jgi:hypothetical protein
MHARHPEHYRLPSVGGVWNTSCSSSPRGNAGVEGCRRLVTAWTPLPPDGGGTADPRPRRVTCVQTRLLTAPE